MPDRDDDELEKRATMQADLAGEPLTATIQDVVDEHADEERRAAEQRAADRAQRERMARHEAVERETVLRHTGGRRRLRPTRVVEMMRRRGEDGRAGGEGRDLDPRWLLGAAVAGVVLAGGVRRVLLLGAIAAGAWALYRRVLEPARDPAVVLQ